jgi:hypothetical protein
MKKTNFDRYLEEQLRDPAFAARYEQAGEAWDVALQIAVKGDSHERSLALPAARGAAPGDGHRERRGRR